VPLSHRPCGARRDARGRAGALDSRPRLRHERRGLCGMRRSTASRACRCRRPRPCAHVEAGVLFVCAGRTRSLRRVRTGRDLQVRALGSL